MSFKKQMKKEKAVLDKCDEINNEYGTNFQKYDSEEKFKQKIEVILLVI